MIWRRQLTVASPISIAAVLRAARDTVLASAAQENQAAARIAAQFSAQAVVTTDSGTSALVLALRLAVPRGGTVAFPAYACVDLAAAALYAGVRVRLYDLDPNTLSPDLAAVERVLKRGADAVLVAHLFGYPADVAGVRALTSAAGVPLIEDAAQAAGGRLGMRPLGSLGNLAVLSFGRGKGFNAGGGGALLGFGPDWSSRLEAVQLAQSGKGWGGLAKTGIQWALGRPGLYALPAMLPGLHLGEMVYHPATEPQGMSSASSSLVFSALDLGPAAQARRARVAAELDGAAKAAPGIEGIRAVAGGASGFLRYAVRDASDRRAPAPRLGIVRPYPQTLAGQPQLSPILVAGEPAIPGADELKARLFTLPTHRFVTAGDLGMISDWLGVPRRA